MPDWMGPPVGALPGVVSLEVVLAKTDDVAVAVTRASAYPTGLEFDLVTIGGPVLLQHGGGGGGANWRQSMWLWPLPGQGTLTLACECPAVGIPLTRHAVDARPLFDAARRAQTLFSFPEPPEGEIRASPAIW